MDLSKVHGNWEKMKAAIPDMLVEYDEDIAKASERLTLIGKSGHQAQKEQCAWPAYYGMRKAEVNKLLKYVGARVEAVRTSLYRRYNEVSSRVLSDRVIDKYIDGEEEYLKIHEVYLEIEELRDKLAAVCDAYSLRGFSLRDWTTLKVNQLQDDLI